MGTNPQEPELWRSEEGATVQQTARNEKPADGNDTAGRPHGTDKGDKGGGRGGGVPPEQRPEHP